MAADLEDVEDAVYSVQHRATELVDHVDTIESTLNTIKYLLFVQVALAIGGFMRGKKTATTESSNTAKEVP